MTSLEETIYTAVAGLSGLTAVAWERFGADDEPDFPYATLAAQASTVADYDSDDVALEAMPCQVSVYSTSREVAQDQAAAVEALFVGQALTMDSGHILHAHKVSEQTTEEPEKTTAGQRVWRCLIILEFEIARSPGQA